MAKQPSKSARADSSTGQSAAAVSSNTDAVAAAEPATPKAPDAADGPWNEARPPVPSLGHTRRSTEVRDETGATVVRRVRCYLLRSLGRGDVCCGGLWSRCWPVGALSGHPTGDR